jgi:hypothetical protein
VVATDGNDWRVNILWERLYFIFNLVKNMEGDQGGPHWTNWSSYLLCQFLPLKMLLASEQRAMPTVVMAPLALS